jgi:phosphoserine aminotransferase
MDIMHRVSLIVRTRLQTRLNTRGRDHVFFCLSYSEFHQLTSRVLETNAKLQLYQAIDQSPHFENRVDPSVRSVMNVPFFSVGGYEYRDAAIDKVFLDFCSSRKLQSLAGHQVVGGFRASIYNAVPEEAVDELIRAIQEFSGFPPRGT